LPSSVWAVSATATDVVSMGAFLGLATLLLF